MLRLAARNVRAARILAAITSMRLGQTVSMIWSMSMLAFIVVVIIITFTMIVMITTRRGRQGLF
jgi:hypothetical protein